MRPTPEEVLRSISYTLDTLIRPDPTSALAVSYLLTVSNMLRQLHLSLQHEETAIGADMADLRDTLSGACTFLRAERLDEDLSGEIQKALDVVPAGTAPAKAAREHWRMLRSILERTIQEMQAHRDRFTADASYCAVRHAIRDYLDRSIDRERVLIDGAFTLARR